jgi:hypothetical protein
MPNRDLVVIGASAGEALKPCSSSMPGWANLNATILVASFERYAPARAKPSM